MAILYLTFFILPSLINGWVREMENENLYQGDMILNPEQMMLAKAGKLTFGSIKDNLWGRSIPYDYDEIIAASTKAVGAIQAAIHDYEKYTCLRFRRKTRHDRTYMLFYKGSGCKAAVGASYGVNKISISTGCWNKGTAIHEIGHALGFHHEQSRPDRDEYLIIHKENIPKDKFFNFDLEKGIDSRGTPYDYRSVMHYDKKAFGGGKITMETKDKYYTDLIGTGNGFSAMDIKQINLVYKCPVYNGPLPVEPTPECHDYSSYCEMWFFNGQCRTEWGRKKCPLTCQKCKVGPNVEPFPTRPDVTTAHPTTTEFVCRDFSERFCQKNSWRCNEPGWRDHMEANCMKTCRICRERPRTQLSVTQEPEPTVASCRDSDPSFCSKYSSYCTTSGRWRDVMEQRCRMTCHICRKPPTQRPT